MATPRLNIQLKKFHPGAVVPEYKSAGAAAFDLHACIGEGNRIWMEQGEVRSVGTGISIFLDNPDYGLFIWERSGLSAKGVERHGGLVDSDYQGEISVVITNNTGNDLVICDGDRIAQAVIQSVWRADFNVVENFSTATERGVKGFGSTGVNDER